MGALSCLAFRAKLTASPPPHPFAHLFSKYYDYHNNRSRFDMHDKTGAHLSLFEFYDGDGSEYRVVNGSVCTVGRIPGGHSHKLGHTDEAGRMRRSTDIFEFGPEFGETYLGQQRARGVLCDVWTREVGHVSHLPARPAHGGRPAKAETNVTVNYTLTYFFSADHWTYRTSTDPLHPLPHRVPVRAEINGTMVFSSGVKPPVNFHHYYDYVAFQSGPPPLHTFQLPRTAVCTDVRGGTDAVSVPEALQPHGHSFPAGIDASCMLHKCEIEMRHCDAHHECHEAMHCMMDDCVPFTLECAKRCTFDLAKKKAEEGHAAKNDACATHSTENACLAAHTTDGCSWYDSKGGEKASQCYRSRYKAGRGDQKHKQQHDHDRKLALVDGTIYGQMLQCIERKRCLSATSEWGFGVSSACMAHQCRVKQASCLGHEHCHKVMADVQARCIPFSKNCAAASFTRIEKQMLEKEGFDNRLTVDQQAHQHPEMIQLGNRWRELMECFVKNKCADELQTTDVQALKQLQAMDDAVGAERAHGQSVAVGVAFAMLLVGAVLGQVAMKRFAARRSGGFNTLNDVNLRETQNSRVDPVRTDAIVAEAGGSSGTV